MKRHRIIAATLALFGAAAMSASAVQITLFDYAFNIDGVVSGPSDPTPGGVNMAGFDTGTGLGTISYSTTGAGVHYFSLFVDHEIDESINTFFNEVGSVSGVPTAGQSWEIDEPGFGPTPGDIYANFTAGTLQNTVGFPGAEDVSMAMGFAFSLSAGQIASIALLISETAPASGFYLTHTDPGSSASIYLSGVLSIESESQGGVPDSGTSFALLGAAFMALLGFRFTRKIERNPHA